MDGQGFVPAVLPDVPLLFAFITALGIMIVIMFCVMAVCVLATSFITLIIYVICDCLCWPCFDRCERDIELGRVSHRARIIAYRAMVPNDHRNNDQQEEEDEEDEVDDGLPNNIEERKALRQQALEKLLPQLVFGTKEMFSSDEDCSICLDDYIDGDFCRVFPACNHMFHLKCIDHWLKNHLTCPVCRKCLLDP
ncbi:hypothetical protein LWI29_022470 [Acer saccharum]|uniref:RING-type domain-containing protein n=1 Tax=Acer saccharum TaxID=4024 RepID=A0AA39SX87_ACESA|nr:hypothetical protein LWI29_022470 [Acer saccharum]